MSGAKITHQFAMAPLGHNMGLFIATQSYDGRMTLSITSERTIMPDIDFFRQCIRDAFADLMAATPTLVAEPVGAKLAG